MRLQNSLKIQVGKFAKNLWCVWFGCLSKDHNLLRPPQTWSLQWCEQRGKKDVKLYTRKQINSSILSFSFLHLLVYKYIWYVRHSFAVLFQNCACDSKNVGCYKWKHGRVYRQNAISPWQMTLLTWDISCLPWFARLQNSSWNTKKKEKKKKIKMNVMLLVGPTLLACMTFYPQSYACWKKSF